MELLIFKRLSLVYTFAMDKIEIFGAKVHNLKDIAVSIPRNTLTVITGPSGSGKSSLAFDTLYAEGQRRYIESLSSYARQFLGQMEPPDVESITGLSPAIAIDQKSTSRNPRSTVGTITEVYDYLRVLYARVGDAYCPETGELLQAQTAQQIVEKLLAKPEKTKLVLMAPVVKGQKGEHRDLIQKFLSMGFSKARFNGKLITLEDTTKLDKNKKNNFDIVVDRLVVREGIVSRLTDSVEQALKLGEGSLFVLADKDEEFYSEHLYSHKTGKSYPELEPRLFSFNSPIGACPECNGLGESKVFDRKKYVLDERMSFQDGAITALGKHGSFYYQMVKCILDQEGVELSTSIDKWPKRIYETIFDGSNKEYTYKFKSESSSYSFTKSFVGLDEWLNKKYIESSSEKVRTELEKYMNIKICPSCEGERLNEYARGVQVQDKGIMDVAELSIEKCYEFFKGVKFTGQREIIASKILKEVNARLKFLNDVGLTYLTLNRAANTLSGGESQRIRLATQIGSALSGVLYVLDEPSIGLHQRDNDKLIATLIRLRDLGNTVIVVEHDEDTMLASDHIIDIGPGAGIHGGEVVAYGSPKEIQKADTETGNYLSGRKKIELPEKRRTLSKFLYLKGVTKNNLQNFDVDIPIGGLVCITGVSGSGKSTLVHNALVPGIKNYLRGKEEYPVHYKSISIGQNIDQVIEIDQSPIGKTPKSNPATYTKLFDEIRKLYANTNEAKVRGYKQGRFSFNVKGGRCEACEGAGQNKVEMNFLPDVYITCQECNGKRYNQETLNITYRGKNIADVLNLSIEEAVDFFKNHKKIHRALVTLDSIGLGYIKLGQSSTTLSGGEAQRLKLSRELSKATRGHCLYILDEPTTGLHFKDIKVLLEALQKLIGLGHTVLVIEHNLDVIKMSDYIIDLGPEGGEYGGQIVATGTPEEVAQDKKSITGKYLKRYL
ncbi:MAG: excinuclease ABC subunit A [Halobacteriovoraceae bacterium]|nr:excinuclease ABC subunit A [Halobacteriovoraceae bacterium]|tara:strand:+ start:18342 stop:21182 length:2841 start_codon:yes stop_codon:yes gene_type:complete